jgi:dienelactone hydrolase
MHDALHRRHGRHDDRVGGAPRNWICCDIGTDMQRIIAESYRIGEIPLITLAREGAEARPMVFYLHGLTSDKQDGLRLGYELAEQGFYVVSLDAPLHGERAGQRVDDDWMPLGGYTYPPDTGLDLFFHMYEIVVQAARDIDVLVEHLAGDSRADTDRIGMTGFSMGAFATFYIAANNPRIQAAVPIAGIPAFAARWEDVLLEASSYERWARAMEDAQAETDRRTAYVRQIDPFDSLSEFYPKPLMMIQGDLDTDCPKKYAVDLYSLLKPLYAGHPERLRLNIQDGAGHELTRAMRGDTCTWFLQHLTG